MKIIPLLEWLKNENNIPGKDMLWEKAFWNQIMFIRDTMPGIFANSYENYKEIIDDIDVINVHTSKSILLPVYNFHIKKERMDVVFIIRHNFYEWGISVDSSHDIIEGFDKLIDVDTGDRIFDKKKFSVSISNEYKLYTFFWLINRIMDNKEKE